MSLGLVLPVAGYHIIDGKDANAGDKAALEKSLTVIPDLEKKTEVDKLDKAISETGRLYNQFNQKKEEVSKNVEKAKKEVEEKKKQEEKAKAEYKKQNVAFVLEDVIKADTPTPEAVVKFGWNKDTKGNWTYVVDSKGTKATGWVNDQGTWYYLNASNGDMKTGWFQVNGKWYYAYGSGALAVNTTVDGYYVNYNGEWVK